MKDAHYDKVGEALIWTLDKGLGEAFTPPVKTAWVETYGTLAGVMKTAAAEVPSEKGPVRAHVRDVSGLLLKSGDLPSWVAPGRQSQGPFA